MKTSNKRILILDAGGVIIEDLSGQFWDLIAAQSTDKALTREHLYREYKKDISDQLWTGQLSEQQLLHFLQTFKISLNEAELRAIIASCLKPLPAFEKVKEWSTKLPVYIMSNHLSDWLLPALEPLKDYISDYYISDVFKIKKPIKDWYDQLSHRHPNTSIFFVDNTLHNIVVAQENGWSTVLADETHSWIQEVDDWISK